MAGANPGSAGFVTDILVGSSAWLGDARPTSTTGNIASTCESVNPGSTQIHIAWNLDDCPPPTSAKRCIIFESVRQLLDTIFTRGHSTRSRGGNTGDSLSLLSYSYTKGISTSALQTRSQTTSLAGYAGANLRLWTKCFLLPPRG